MKKLIFLFLVAVSFQSTFAKEGPLSVEEIKARLEVRVELYVFDASGKRVTDKYSQELLLRPVVVDGKSEIKHNWGGEYLDGIKLNFHQKWTVNEDGTIKVHLEEYGREEGFKNAKGEDDTRFTKLIKEEDFVLENFDPVNWVSPKSDSKRRVVIRLTPNLNDEWLPKKMDELPISGTDMQLTDNEGNLWVEHTTLSGKYIGLRTHKGTLFLSFYPFKGATELGVASGNKIEVKLGGKKTGTLSSQSDFVPKDVRATVYGVHLPQVRTDRLYSVATHATNIEKEIVEKVKREFK